MANRSNLAQILVCRAQTKPSRGKCDLKAVALLTRLVETGASDFSARTAVSAALDALRIRLRVFLLRAYLVCAEVSCEC